MATRSAKKIRKLILKRGFSEDDANDHISRLPTPNDLEEQMIADGHENMLRRILADTQDETAKTCSLDEFKKRLKNKKTAYMTELATDGGDRHGAGYENARAFRECDRAAEERPDMSDECEEALYGLSQIQEKAAGWDDGSGLVLAGPGAGKTRVLTKRVARLLQGSPDLHFKVLSLTFTTKAAAEMRERVDTYVPGVAENRTFIETFHAFCTQTVAPTWFARERLSRLRNL